MTNDELKKRCLLALNSTGEFFPEAFIVIGVIAPNGDKKDVMVIGIPKDEMETLMCDAVQKVLMTCSSI